MGGILFFTLFYAQNFVSYSAVRNRRNPRFRHSVFEVKSFSASPRFQLLAICRKVRSFDFKHNRADRQIGFYCRKHLASVALSSFRRNHRKIVQKPRVPLVRDLKNGVSLRLAATNQFVSLALSLLILLFQKLQRLYFGKRKIVLHATCVKLFKFFKIQFSESFRHFLLPVFYILACGAPKVKLLRGR